MEGNPSSFSFSIPATRRIGASPLTGMVVKRLLGEPAANTCSGPVSSTYSGNSPIDDFSPGSAMWAGVSTNDEPDLCYLPPGSRCRQAL